MSSSKNSKEKINFADPALKKRVLEESLARLAEDLEMDTGSESFSDILGLAPSSARPQKYKTAPLTNRDANTTDVDKHDLKHLYRYVKRRRNKGLSIPGWIQARIRAAEERVVEKGETLDDILPEEENGDLDEDDADGGDKDMAKAGKKGKGKGKEDNGWLLV